MNKTQERLNQVEYDTYKKRGSIKVGAWSSWIWRDDPKHLLFLLSRYKFCSKILQGKKRVLEVGCGDSFGLSIVLQTVDYIHAVDVEPLIIDEAKKILDSEVLDKINLSTLDITQTTINENVDAAYSLDCFEHIPQECEDAYFKNICKVLPKEGVCIIGIPNKEAHKFASELSSQGHINLKTADELKSLMSKYFSNVFLFSMNDEVVHTGYHGMAHYIFGVGVGLIDKLEKD